MIGKAAKPHCFRNWNASRYVHYYNNSTAWMKENVSLHEGHHPWGPAKAALASVI